MHADDPDFASRIEASLARPLVHTLFGIRASRIEAGAVEIYLDHRPELGHSPGWFQGTIITAIAEFAAAWSAVTLIPGDWNNLTLTQTINFTGAARGDRLIARGRVIQPGRTISNCCAEIFVRREGQEFPCAFLIQTNRHAPA